MKTKKLNKNLTLCKKTITNLGKEELNVVKGGEPSHGLANCVSLVCYTPADTCP